MTRNQAKVFLEFNLEKLEEGQHIFIEPSDSVWLQALKIAILEIELRLGEHGRVLEEIKQYANKNLVSDINS